MAISGSDVFFFYLKSTIINPKDNVYLSKSRNFVEHAQAFVKDLSAKSWLPLGMGWGTICTSRGNLLQNADGPPTHPL